MMALNMLRRWLNGQPLASEHGWINVVDSSRCKSFPRRTVSSGRRSSNLLYSSEKNSVR